AGMIFRCLYDNRIALPYLSERIRKYKEEQAAFHAELKAVLTPDVIPDDIIRWRFFGTYLPESVVEKWLDDLTVMAVRLEKKHGAIHYFNPLHKPIAALRARCSPIEMVNYMRKAVRDSIRDGMSSGTATGVDEYWYAMI